VDQRSQGSPVVAGAVGDRLMLWSLRFTLVGFAAISIVVLAELLSIVPFLEPLPTSESVLFIAAAAWVVTGGDLGSRSVSSSGPATRSSGIALSGAARSRSRRSLPWAPACCCCPTSSDIAVVACWCSAWWRASQSSSQSSSAATPPSRADSPAGWCGWTACSARCCGSLPGDGYRGPMPSDGTRCSGKPARQARRTAMTARARASATATGPTGHEYRTARRARPGQRRSPEQHPDLHRAHLPPGSSSQRPNRRWLGPASSMRRRQ
jgi:hypothetical protein